jgi:ribosomal 50S subunit-recycling heat shock protein
LRLDKFLKISRIVKRRTIANQLCDAGKVDINDKVAKASSTLKRGDKLTLHFGNKTIEATVEQIPEKTPLAENAHLLYTILRETYNQSESTILAP